ncbi:MAG: xanthine dehydrogenase family protein molybdopterin-binding subunit [Rhodospirillaceae bacterium]|nr:xanthine dehydrogenase family protein molybdopterin-binding subunit [Rhodospirillaceae bacterium]
MTLQAKARIDAALKVTGQVKYPSDAAVKNPVYAYFVTSAVAKGRIKSINTDQAKRVDGFIDILTHENTKGEIKTQVGYPGFTNQTVETDEIQHDGQIVGMVVAESYEAAREAAHKVQIQYEAQYAAPGFDADGITIRSVEGFDANFKAPRKGDAAKAYEQAPVKIEAVYETPTQHHNAMELHSTICEWQDGKLTIHEASQFVYRRAYLADCLGIDEKDVRVLSRFAGGSFGSKVSCTVRAVLAAIAARRLNRPVKLVATRSQAFTVTTYRAETRHAIKLGATKDGKLDAYIHDSFELTSRPSNYNLAGGIKTASSFYNYGNVATSVSVVNADRNMPGWMRSPHELVYMFGLECALDELAYALNLDPIELRRRNDTQVDPISGLPYSSRSLMQCFDAASAAFGWANRNPTPKSMRDGDWLVGLGCASACYPANIGASSAGIEMNADGRVKVQIAFQEVGQGGSTVIAQTTAEKLGVPLENVSVELGDTNLPPGTITAGSNGTATTLSALLDACEKLRERIATAAVDAKKGLFSGAKQDALHFTTGGLTGRAGTESLAVAVGRLGGTARVIGQFARPDAPANAVRDLGRGIPLFGGHRAKDFVAFSHGAQFVEVRVHARTGEIRVPRVVGAFAAGKIINDVMARSQLMGGMIWGIGGTLHEATEMDRRAARYVNTNFADYMIPVNADIKDVQVLLVPEVETRLNAVGAKGVGELGSIGVNSAIANAVFHATGRRIRKLPIRLEDLV